MIDTIIIRLGFAAVSLIVLFPIVWCVLKISAIRSAAVHKIAWGIALFVPFGIMSVPMSVPVPKMFLHETKNNRTEGFATKNTSTQADNIFIPTEQSSKIDFPIQSQREGRSQQSGYIAATPGGQAVSKSGFTIALSETPPASFEKTSGISIFPIVFTLWMTGVVGLLGHRFILHLRLRQMMKTFELSDPGKDNSWTVLLKENRISPKTIPMYLTSSIGPALVQTGLQKRLLIPRTVWEDLPDDLLRSVLKHELAHHLNRDVILSPIAFFLAVIQWFHPLSWAV